MSDFRVVALEPYVIRHDAQVGKFFNHRKVLQLAAEVLEVHVVGIKLVFELRVGRRLHEWLHCPFVLFFGN